MHQDLVSNIVSCEQNIVIVLYLFLVLQVLFCAVIGLSFTMMCLKGFNGPWYRYMFRFVLLFSYIIPISLRVNLDMGKAFYSYQIQNDPEIKGNDSKIC